MPEAMKARINLALVPALLALAACAPAGGRSPSAAPGQAVPTTADPLAIPVLNLAPSLSGPASLEGWEIVPPASWAVDEGVLRLHTAGVPGGAIRRPAAWAILRSEPLGSFVLDAQVRADAPVTRMGRDVLIFFGYQSPTRFYYAHLSNETTAPHNGIFLVNDADRVRIDDGRGIPRLMDADWHNVRLERDVRTGEIRVYLDDKTRPLLQARDTTLREGRIGFGSFDDPAAFRAVLVRGEAAKR